MGSKLAKIDTFDSLVKTAASKKKPYKACHSGAIEIYEGLFLSSFKDSDLLVTKANVDIVVPLDSCSSSIWDNGWRGQIWYYPTQDYGVLPLDLAKTVGNRIVDAIKSGLKVGVFCIGGHGRTGYIASIVLGLLGVDFPISFIRKHYCINAVESKKQVDQIAKILGIKPELLYESDQEYLDDVEFLSRSYGFGSYGYGYGSAYGYGSSSKSGGTVKGYYDDFDSSWYDSIDKVLDDKTSEVLPLEEIASALEAEEQQKLPEEQDEYERCIECDYYDLTLGYCDLHGMQVDKDRYRCGYFTNEYEKYIRNADKRLDDEVEDSAEEEAI